ncbi:hypothetical protein OA066_02295 [SAR86 cluster bacterium]|nr:hypothetical protein [SAR86 cluster bacterium]
MIDRKINLPGYFKSPWPVECGGNRRQKSVNGSLNAKDSQPKVQSISSDRWNVMVIRRDKDEFYLGGTMPYFFGPEPYGWIQKFDSKTLEVLAESPKLPCGGHVWCGAIAAHENGNIIKVNGNYMHSLNSNCELLREKKLPINRAHNGLLILSDGTIITKDCRLEGQGNSFITRLDPDTLELIHEPFGLPEGSMGRIASEFNDQGEFIYVPGIESILRIKVNSNSLELDDSWMPKYRDSNGPHGLAWDGCISDGSIWLMDNGDIQSVRDIYGTEPNGRFNEFKSLSWRSPAPWKGKQRLIKIDTRSGRFDSLKPFEDLGGGIIAPPVNIPEANICVAWDSINGGIVGVDTSEEMLQVSWLKKYRPTMQPVVFPESNELVINNYENGSDQIIVLDVRNGELLSKADVNSKLANGMFLTPGNNRDIFYCSTGAFSRISWS